MHKTRLVEVFDAHKVTFVSVILPPGPAGNATMDYKLSTPQRALLEPAAARADGSIFPLPTGIKGTGILSVIAALVRKGLVVQEGKAAHITDTGRHAIGAPVPERVPTVAESASVAPDLPVTPEPAHDAPVALSVPAAESPAPPRLRPETKQAKLIAMLSRPEGATIDQLVEATAWQRHTIRGAISGALRKKLGLKVSSERTEGCTVYRISPAE